MALILERGYDTLTVHDITERANVSRATFYLHFKDKEELLFNSMEAVYDDLVEGAAGQLPPEAGHTAPWYDVRDFQHVADHYDFYRVMFSERGVWRFISRVQDYLARAYTATFLDPMLAGRQAPPVPVALVAQYHAAAQIGLIRWWVLQGLPYPPEQMAQVAYHLFADGAWQCLGILDLKPDLPLPAFPPPP